MKKSELKNLIREIIESNVTWYKATEVTKKQFFPYSGGGYVRIESTSIHQFSAFLKCKGIEHIHITRCDSTQYGNEEFSIPVTMNDCYIGEYQQSMLIKLLPNIKYKKAKVKTRYGNEHVIYLYSIDELYNIIAELKKLNWK